MAAIAQVVHSVFAQQRMTKDNNSTISQPCLPECIGANFTAVGNMMAILQLMMIFTQMIKMMILMMIIHNDSDGENDDNDIDSQHVNDTDDDDNNDDDGYNHDDYNNDDDDDDNNNDDDNNHDADDNDDDDDDTSLPLVTSQQLKAIKLSSPGKESPAALSVNSIVLTWTQLYIAIGINFLNISVKNSQKKYSYSQKNIEWEGGIKSTSNL